MGPTISSTAETVPCARAFGAQEAGTEVAAAAAEERSLYGVGLEGSDECRSSKERDLNISEVVCGSPGTGDNEGGGRGQGPQWRRRRRRRRWRGLEHGNGGPILEPDLLQLAGADSYPFPLLPH